MGTPLAIVNNQFSEPPLLLLPLETARVLNITTPQHERFFRAADEPARELTLAPQAPPDMDKLAATANEHGVEILGPPPGARG